MEITFLGVVFAVIIVLLAIGRPLYQAIAGGMGRNSSAVSYSGNNNWN